MFWHRGSHTIQGSGSITQNISWVKVCPDNNQVTDLTPIRSPNLYHQQTLQRGVDLYLMCSAVPPNVSKQTLLLLQQHKWLRSAGWVFSAWKEGCIIYRRLWQNCPEWVLSLSTTSVNSSNAPRDPYNYTVLIPTLPYSHSTHSTACSFTANYQTSLNKAPPLWVPYFRGMITSVHRDTVRQLAVMFYRWVSWGGWRHAFLWWKTWRRKYFS